MQLTSLFTDIAEAIRQRGNTTGKIQGTLFAQAILDIPDTGGVPPFPPPFATATWAQIADVSQNIIKSKGLTWGALPFFTGWSVGDTKPINIGGTNYNVQIIGVNHDDLVSGGKAGLTLQLQELYTTMYPMNATSTNVGGWGGSAMRTSTIPAIKSLLPLDLQPLIRPVTKQTIAGNLSLSIVTSQDDLFLLSPMEASSNTAYSEGEEYSYYKFVNPGNTGRIKNLTGNPTTWGLRSPQPSTTVATNFMTITTAGASSNSAANNTRGVSFAFCI